MSDTMQLKNEGMAWHVHHDRLLEWCTNYQKRVRYIHNYKRGSEIPRRLDLFRFVKGRLPDEVEVAGKLVGKKTRLCHDAWESLSHPPLAVEQDLVRKTQVAAWCALDGLDAAIEKHKAEIEAMHARECPDCPWNGETIFPKETNHVRT